jgi:hypothetical protein
MVALLVLRVHKMDVVFVFVFKEEMLGVFVCLDLQIRLSGCGDAVGQRETHGMQGRTISLIHPQAITGSLGGK